MLRLAHHILMTKPEILVLRVDIGNLADSEEECRDFEKRLLEAVPPFKTALSTCSPIVLDDVAKQMLDGSLRVSAPEGYHVPYINAWYEWATGLTKPWELRMIGAAVYEVAERELRADWYGLINGPRGGVVAKQLGIFSFTRFSLQSGGEIATTVHSSNNSTASWFKSYGETCIQVLLGAFALLNCKNISAEHVETIGPTRKWLRRQRQPEIRYRTLRIAVPGTRKTNRESATRVLTSGDIAQHLCRGHVRHYDESGSGMFGKGIFGPVYVPQHIRGNKKNGQVYGPRQLVVNPKGK